MFGNILFILRFTRYKSISARWILSEHERSVISKHYEEMIGKADRSTEERKKRILMWPTLKNIYAVVETVEDMINPFL